VRRTTEVDDCPRCGKLFDLQMASYCKHDGEVAICHECGTMEIMEGSLLPEWSGHKYWEGEQPDE